MAMKSAVPSSRSRRGRLRRFGSLHRLLERREYSAEVFSSFETIPGQVLKRTDKQHYYMPLLVRELYIGSKNIESKECKSCLISLSRKISEITSTKFLECREMFVVFGGGQLVLDILLRSKGIPVTSSHPPYLWAPFGLQNECLAILRELCFTMPTLAESLSARMDVILFLFSLMHHKATFDNAVGLMEELLALRETTINIAHIPNFEKLALSLSCRRLAFFCRIMALLVFEPEDRNHDSLKVFKASDILSARRRRVAAPLKDTDRNHAVILRIPGLLERIAKLIGIPSDSSSGPSQSSGHGHVHRDPSELVAQLRVPQQMLLNFQQLAAETGRDNQDGPFGILGSALDLLQLIESMEGPEDWNGDDDHEEDEEDEEDEEEEEVDSDDESDYESADDGERERENVVIRNPFLSLKALTVATHQVEVLFVLCTLLGGKRKIEVQNRLSSMDIVPSLVHFFDRLSWGSKPLQDQPVERLHGPGCECNPESALKVQFLRLLHNFCDQEAQPGRTIRDSMLSKHERRRLARGEVTDLSSIRLPVRQSSQFHRHTHHHHGHGQYDTPAPAAATAQQHTTRTVPTNQRPDSNGHTNPLLQNITGPPQHQQTGTTGTQTGATAGGGGGGGDRMSHIHLVCPLLADPIPFPADVGLLGRLLIVLMQEPSDSNYRFWLASCIEAFLRSSTSADQIFVARSGVLLHLVKEIMGGNMANASSLQTSFDLLGEILKFNRMVFLLLNKAIVTVGESSRFAEIALTHLVDSNVFIRSITLSLERFADEDALNKHDTSHIPYPFESCSLNRFLQSTRFRLVKDLMAVVTVDELSQENICCVNTALVFLILANYKGQLPQLLQDVREAEAQDGKTVASTDNFRSLLDFWREYYSQRGRDCLNIEVSSKISFKLWKSTVELLCGPDDAITSLSYKTVSRQQ